MPKTNTVAREYAERTLEKESVLTQFMTDISRRDPAVSAGQAAHAQDERLNYEGNGDKS